jgi:hypothetical protein
MNEELKKCPFCGGQLEFFGHDIDHEMFYDLPEEQIVAIYRHPYSDDEHQCALGGLVFKYRLWQNRPLEDDLLTSISDLKMAYQEESALSSERAVYIRLLEENCVNLITFSDRIRNWLSKGYVEPMWYEDFMEAIDKLAESINPE